MKAIVIGAGPAGIATAASLKAEGAEVSLFEASAAIGSSWRGHYDCLKLPTSRSRSTLPGFEYPKDVGRYPTRAQVIRYLEDYASHHGLVPALNCPVKRICRDGTKWIVDHANGQGHSDVVVVATGMNQAPKRPEWPGAADFAGEITHARDYRNPTAFAGKTVCVVGFGNTAGDIALDLAQAGVSVTMSVRGPVNILPKALLGVPITSFGLLSRLLGYKLADRLTAPILRMTVGRPADYGLQALAKGPGAQVIEDGRIPLIDVGTLGAIKAGQITVRPAITSLGANGVTFADGETSPVDHIIAATGYSCDLRSLLGEDCAALDECGKPRISGAKTDVPGLYFCSFKVSPNGQLFATGQEAQAIARDAARNFALAST